MTLHLKSRGYPFRPRLLFSCFIVVGVGSPTVYYFRRGHTQQGMLSKKKGEDTVAWYPPHRNRMTYVRLEAVAHRDSGVDVEVVIAYAPHKIASRT